MKSFLSGLMAASLMITMVGCGGKKEEKPKAPVSSEYTTDIPVMSEEDLMEMIENEAAMQELEDELARDMVDEDEEAALRDLAELIQKEIESNPDFAKQMAAMGSDEFALGNLSEDEAQQMAAWQADALEWAKQEFDLASAESAEMGFNSLQFAEASSSLDAQSADFAKNVELAKNAIDAGKDIVLQGHAAGSADGSGDVFQLAESRALAVKEALVQQGLDADHIHVASYGDAMPASQESESRRVGFMVC
jgi:outer membrane protein OmpA-like peptidoglycan-associated protein